MLPARAARRSQLSPAQLPSDARWLPPGFRVAAARCRPELLAAATELQLQERRAGRRSERAGGRAGGSAPPARLAPWRYAGAAHKPQGLTCALRSGRVTESLRWCGDRSSGQSFKCVDSQSKEVPGPSLHLCAAFLSRPWGKTRRKEALEREAVWARQCGPVPHFPPWWLQALITLCSISKAGSRPPGFLPPRGPCSLVFSKLVRCSTFVFCCRDKTPSARGSLGVRVTYVHDTGRHPIPQGPG